MIPIADIWHPPLGICYPRQKIVNAQGLPLGRGEGGMGAAGIDWCISLLTSKLPNKTVKSCPLLASFYRMKSLIKLKYSADIHTYFAVLEESAPKKQKTENFRQKEKRKRDQGQSARGKSYVEEEKRILRQEFSAEWIVLYTHV